MAVASADPPLALRPGVAFPPIQVSIFEDPGDEKSWHRSQRSESLRRFYGDREPSWYASAIAPLSGAERVLDLGCGPGLALQALLDMGASNVWGIDRWPSFATGLGEGARIVAHDLTLPMPFFSSGFFDGVLSHYALDYLSPIGMRQVLREARRVLAPEGRLVIYVAAVGLGSRDETRTAAYRPSAMKLLLQEAGFDRIEVDAPGDGRNSVVTARRPSSSSGVDGVGVRGTQVQIDGELQISASFSGGEEVRLELIGKGRHALFRFEQPVSRSPDSASCSVCARVQQSTAGGTELQVWVWQGFSSVLSERVQLEFAPVGLRVDCGGRIDHLCSWNPEGLSLEPPGNACRRPGDLPSGDALTEAERGAEGRQVIVESREGERADPVNCLGPGRNRFLIRRAAGVEISEIDREWLSGHAHGIALFADELAGEGLRDLLLWAGWRQALVFLGGPDWDCIIAAASSRSAELLSPVVLVDPALSTAAAQRLPPDVAHFAEASSRSFVLLSSESMAHTGASELERLARRLLHGGRSAGDVPLEEVATENLRYLTERTLLMRLRQAHGRSPAEVGRRPV
ncbi:MAG TPA: class I SAM-dependent methyltransferase [Candidatus Dormibacteraeota bacterium]